MIALGYRELGNSLLWQWIIVIANTYMTWINAHKIQDLRSAYSNVKTRTAIGILASERS